MDMKIIRELSDIDQAAAQCYILSHRHTKYYSKYTGFSWTFSFEDVAYWNTKFTGANRHGPFTFEEMKANSDKSLYLECDELYLALSLFQGYLIRKNL